MSGTFTASIAIDGRRRHRASERLPERPHLSRTAQLPRAHLQSARRHSRRRRRSRRRKGARTNALFDLRTSPVRPSAEL